MKRLRWFLLNENHIDWLKDYWSRQEYQLPHYHGTNKHGTGRGMNYSHDDGETASKIMSKELYSGENMHKPAMEVDLSGPIIDHISTHIDPSPKKHYTDWLSHQYNEGNFKIGEDDQEIKDSLTYFHNNKSKIGTKNIKDFDTIGSLHQAVDKASAKSGSSVDFSHPDAPVVHDGANLKIWELKTKEASQATRLTRSSRNSWCTSRNDKDCAFDDYSHTHKDNIEHNVYGRPTPHAKLYMIKKHETGEHFQWHPESGELRDRYDSRVSMQKFAKDNPEIREVGAFRQHGFHALPFMNADGRKEVFDMYASSPNLITNMPDHHKKDLIEQMAHSPHSSHLDALVAHPDKKVRRYASAIGPSHLAARMTNDGDEYVRMNARRNVK